MSGGVVVVYAVGDLTGPTVDQALDRAMQGVDLVALENLPAPPEPEKLVADRRTPEPWRRQGKRRGARR